ncbi:MAG: PASTA domain-containing protein [Actinomycetota bacterium]
MKRWERELERLRELTLSGRARARVDRGPEGDGMPPAPARGQRVLAGVVAFAVFGGAVALAAGAFGGDDAPPLGTDPEPAVITLEARDAGPEITLTFGGDEAGQQCMSYGWEMGGGSSIFDCVLGDFSQADFLPIPQGRELTVVNPDGADPIDLWIVEDSSWPGSIVERGEPLRPEGLSSIGPGRYVITVEASWPQGDVTNYFAVEIVDAVPDPAGGVLVATLDAPEAGSMPDLVLSYGGVTEDFFAQGGEWPGVTGFDEPLLHFTPTLAPGTVLQIGGDADDVQAWVEAVDEDDRLTGAKTLLDVSSGAAALPSGVTRYQLEIWGSWSDGTAGYFVRIEIGGPETSEPPPSADELLATLDAPDDGSLPTFSLSYGDHEKGFRACGGRWNGDQTFCASIDVSFDAPVEPGTLLRIAGDADEVTGETTLMWPEGGLAPPDALDLTSGTALLPTEPGTYLLSLTGHWLLGRAGISVDITIGDPPRPELPPTPVIEPGIVPDVVGIGEGDAFKLLSLAGFEAESTYEPAPGVAAGLVVSMDPEPGSTLDPGSTVRLVVSGISLALDGYLTELACPSGDMIPFAHTGGVLQPAGDAYIRVNVEGVTSTDEVVQFRFDQGEQPMGLWYVIRDGDVLAVIHVPTLQGVACRGSGIGGT